jgi:uncharacterized protein
MLEISARRLCSFALAALFILVTDGHAQQGPDQRNLINNGTVRLMSGGYESTDLRLAVDMANALDDDYDLRVIPMIGKGSVRNVEDLLYLRGVDLAMVQSDVLDFYRRTDEGSNIDDRLRYIAKLHDEEVHVLAGPDIADIDGLRGRRVNVGPPGSGSFMTGGIIFNDLGIEVDIRTDPPQEALQKLIAGEIDAMLLVDGAPVSLVKDLGADSTLNLIALPPSRISGTYTPASLTSEHYPDLIKSYAPIETVAVSEVLASYNWSDDNPRAASMKRFVEQFFNDFEKLLGPSYHPKWRSVDLSEDLPGWQRVAFAEKASVQAAAAIIEYGEYLSLECVACHQAVDSDGAIPVIAVLPAPYFLNALKSYRSGDRRHLVMQDVAFSLNDEQMEALAAYFASLREATQ